MIVTRARQLLSSKFIQDTLVLQIGKIVLTLVSALSTIVVTRLMGPSSYGLYRQSDTYYNLWKAFDLTGVGTSTSTRLGLAVGGDNRDEIHNLMAFYVQVSLVTTIGLALLLGIFGAATAQVLQGNATIGVFAAFLALTGPADALYGLVIVALQSRRSFRTLTLLQNINQFVLTVSMIAAVLISPTPEGLVVARLFYSYSTMVIALVLYERIRARDNFEFPSMAAVFARVPRLSPRPYWRFGFANALDKNISNLYIHLPVFLVGLIGGARAVGFLTLSLTGIVQASILTSAVFDNMQAVVPQWVGRGDYGKLWRNFIRVVGVLTLGAVAFYGTMALLAPLVIPPLFGPEWLSAVPVLIPLTIYGAVTTVGGVFGPLYRAFGMLRGAFAVKLIALVIALPVGITLMQNAAASAATFFGWSHFDAVSTGVAIAGAWTINLLFILSVVLTMAFTLPVLRRKAASLPQQK
jgi:O-antigen/teichoic acid export membrane protein